MDIFYRSTCCLAALAIFFLTSCGLTTTTLTFSPSRKTLATLPIQAAPAKAFVASPTLPPQGHVPETLPTVILNHQQLPVIQVNGLTPPELSPTHTPVISLDQPKSTVLFSSGGSGDGHRSSSSSTGTQATMTPQPNHQLQITDVVLTETGQSIVSTNTSSTASIVPNYAGRTVSLTIHGTFNTAPDTTLEHMAFVMEPGLLHQSWVGKEPSVRVLLDQGVVWTPVSVSPTQIVVTLNTQGIPDLYLKGNSHNLRVEAGQLIAEVPVRVGEPEASAMLSPVISQIEILRDEQNRPLNLKATGKNLMLVYHFSHIQVDGKPVFGHQTNVVSGADGLSWEKIIHLPEDFVEDGSHTLLYVTPYGATFKGFDGFTNQGFGG